MRDLVRILRRSYFYTKNHTFLWFFGLFLTSGGVLNLIKYEDFNYTEWRERYYAFVSGRFESVSTQTIFIVVAGTLVFFAVALVVASLCKAAIIGIGSDLERDLEGGEHHPVNFRRAFKHGSRDWVRIFVVNVYFKLALLFTGLWLFLPGIYVTLQGFYVRGALLGLLGMIIFLPIYLVLSLADTFAECYIVVYGMHVRAAIHSAFDLLFTFIGDSIALYIMLFLIYVLLFMFSAAMLGLAGVLALTLSVLLKSVSARLFLVLFVAFLAIVMIVINSVLNVFSLLAWTLYFMQIVRARKHPGIVPGTSKLLPKPDPEPVHGR